MSTTARLVFDDSERNADLYYLTRFLVGDPVLYLEVDGRKTLFLSDLEVDRGRRDAAVDEIARLKEIQDRVGDALPSSPPARVARLVTEIARERGIDAFEVPGSFPVSIADALRGHGLGVRWVTPFVPARALKTPEEVERIRGAIRHTEAALTAAIERIRAAEIRDGGLYADGEPLTSEAVRRTVNGVLLDRNCHFYDVIVAGGDQAVDPHERGHGPLPANLPIILDVFPRDNATRYHGDMTRTVVRGEASAEAKRMFEAVRDAKAAAEGALRDGVDGKDVHACVQKVFDERGFATEQRDGRMVGFFHGTGHGLGLEVHEAPRVSVVPDTLRAGHVVTIEPGLYYPGVGGVRIEDDVLVTADGCENLCTLPAGPFEV